MLPFSRVAHCSIGFISLNRSAAKMPQNLSDCAHQNLVGNIREYGFREVFKIISGPGTLKKRENKTRFYIIC
jgi:hypothetical protein